jgi:hypothetical protein
VVGAYLGAELDALAARFPEIGAVHGEGLYRGVDIVVPGADTRPAPAAATQICERMLELGVVVQPTGVALNVLKIKPPLCFRHGGGRPLPRPVHPGAGGAGAVPRGRDPIGSPASHDRAGLPVGRPAPHVLSDPAARRTAR